MSGNARSVSGEGSLQAPERHALDWKSPAFFDRDALMRELERVYDICHGCRRCFNLCHAFPTLFDLIDECESMDLDGVAVDDYWKVVDHCYLCDLCFMTKCPYVPPHEWNVDFPHLMLRAKAVRHRERGSSLRDRVLSSTDAVGRLATIPVAVGAVNAANGSPAIRAVMQRTLGVHREARLPEYHAPTARRRLAGRAPAEVDAGRLRVAVFTTCYGNYNDPRMVEDLVAVLDHNGIEVRIAEQERCCGMPKLELGDLEAVERLKDHNIPWLAALAREGWLVVAPVPSCVLMFRQELPLLFADDADVKLVAAAMRDPFELLAHLHREGRLDIGFRNSLGRVAYHAACHQRVQNIGARTREILELVPDTEVVAIERCSGHDGTYGVKLESHQLSVKIARPVVRRVAESGARYFTSDCVMAGRHIEHGLDDAPATMPPMSLLRLAYGI